MKKYPQYIFALLPLMISALAGKTYADTKAAEYLSEYYNVAPFSAEECSDVSVINDALAALGCETPIPEGAGWEAVIAEGIRLAGLDELALTYVNDAAPDKAKETLARENVSVEDEAYAPYIACALDLGLIDSGETMPADPEEFLYRCLEIGGKGRHFIGRVNDDNILSELQAVLDEIVLFDEGSLTELGKQIVLSGAATGYNLKYNLYDARFLADYTLKYGHDDKQHAIQLIGLLRSEGMDAYIQLEPKVSVYEYMPDWGDPGEPTPTYAVYEVEEGRYLCYAVEYDILLEFDSAEAKEAFHQVVEDYAKKYDDRVDAEGNITEKLLAESWWQPLYSSSTEMENEEFGELVDNIVYDKTGEYSIHSFSLPDKAGEITELVKETAPDLEVNPVTIYVNPAFMRYITDEDYQ